MYETLIEGSLEVKLPTVWRYEKQSSEVESEERSYRCAKVSRKKIQGREMLGKSRSAVFFKWLAGAESHGQRGNEKLHAVVARSSFSSQKPQNTPCSDRFWKFSCQRILRRCGAKRVFQSTCTKHASLGPLLQVPTWKNGTPLWREARFQVIYNAKKLTVSAH